jgi:hypothetical protein
MIRSPIGTERNNQHATDYFRWLAKNSPAISIASSNQILFDSERVRGVLDDGQSS